MIEFSKIEIYKIKIKINSIQWQNQLEIKTQVIDKNIKYKSMTPMQREWIHHNG